MASKWTLTELTELDLRLQRNRVSEFQSRDGASEETGSKAEVLRRWVKRQRNADPEAARLAGIATRSVSWLGFSWGLFSFITGVSAAAALLRYQGNMLMNVSNYLGILVGLQLLFLILAIVSSIIFRKKITGLQKVFLPPQIKNLASPLSIRAWSWRIFTLLQLSGIAFNAGVLLMTLGKGITHDLAFGWATTLNTTAESVHRIVQALASPWGGSYAPTQDQIHLSRITLGNQLNAVDISATAAWWPFIMMCVLVYGLLPRGLLSLWGLFQFNRFLKKPNLDSPECERLYLALTRKSFGFSGTASEPPTPSSSAEFPSAFKPEKPLRLQMDGALLSADRKQDFTGKVQELLDIELSASAEGVLMLMELWQPPLEESLRGLRSLRAEIASDADILILGVGFPSEQEEAFFQAPDQADLEIWRKRLGELKDPRLGIIPWRAP